MGASTSQIRSGKRIKTYKTKDKDKDKDKDKLKDRQIRRRGGGDISRGEGEIYTQHMYVVYFTLLSIKQVNVSYILKMRTNKGANHAKFWIVSCAGVVWWLSG